MGSDGQSAPGAWRHKAGRPAAAIGRFERDVLVSPALGRGHEHYSSADQLEAGFRWRGAEKAKRAVDLASVLVLAAVLSPFIVPLLVAMALSNGPIIYAHRRIGRDGKMFNCFKFRTMVPDADKVLYDVLERSPELKAEWLRDHKLRDDPRVTRIGAFLRRTSLDELPQLWNVLRGEMSMVGPRPIVKEELLRYGRSAPVYLSAKPGVTGLWQVSGRNNTDYRRRVAIDVYYVRNRSTLLDLYILIRTVRVVMGGRGAY
jgi:undecaprenyl-phosphate galactose phosphotransferase